jgi:membrane dipeptidase
MDNQHLIPMIMPLSWRLITHILMKKIFALLIMTLISTSCSTNKTPSTEPIPVMDLHADTLNRVVRYGLDLADEPGYHQVCRSTLEKGHVSDQVFAVWVWTDAHRRELGAKDALMILDAYDQQMAKHSDFFLPVTTVAQAEEAQRQGKVASWLWLEGGDPINNSLEQLNEFYDRGIRGMTLTWTSNTDWGGSCNDDENPQMGLTDFGKDVVREMNRLGMVIDLSHVSEKTFYDAVEVSTDPVIATHSNCMTLCDNLRNLTDDQLRAIAHSGGVVGICLLPSYLLTTWDHGWETTEEKIIDQVNVLKEKYGEDVGGPQYREERRQLIQANLPAEFTVTLDTYLDHIDHAVEVMGWEHVAIGSDFDGIWAFPTEITKSSDWQKVVQGLRNRGYSEKIIQGIMRNNVHRVFRQVIDE